MDLKPGAKLGPYEIVSRIGEGGMGQVWKARDIRLDRIVAIKTSHKKFSERFEREARAVAALNHPHICTLYDVGPDYLVMEYVDGPEIKGPLPAEQVLKLGIELASALEAAHRNSIVHRDLKPANILTIKSGIKVLDFGLAKTEQAKAATASDETVTRALTQEGTIVGTLQYMAPEQLQGRPVDARADIFSFGCVLYEMLTAKRAFDGANTASVIAAILERPAPSTGPVAPASLDWALQRCMAKDPDERWQTARDLRAALERISQIAEEALHKRPPRALWLAWGVASFGIAAAIAVSAIHFRETPPEMPVTRFVIEPPENTHFTGSNGPAPTVSPDGRNLVFGAVSADGKSELWLRPLDSLTARPLPETENASYPFWSPDSKSIGYFSAGKLKKIAIAGGTSTPIADVSDPRGGAWSQNDVIVFTPSPYGGLLQVSASGGAVKTIAAPDSKNSRRFPAFLPDGRHVIYISGNTSSGYTLRVASLDSVSDDRPLPGTTDSFAEYAQGQLLFVQGNTLMARPYDAKSLSFTGNAVPVAEHIQTGPSVTGTAKFSVSATGVVVYRSGVTEERLTWFDRGGKRLESVGEPSDMSGIFFSPDRKTVAVVARDASGPKPDIWLYNVLRGIRTRFTFDLAQDSNPVWSPDGRTIVFRSDRTSLGNLYRKPADGASNEELLFSDPYIKTPFSFSPDGKNLAYQEQTPKTGNDIWILPDPLGPLGASKPYPFVQTDFEETAPHFSPDGHWIAYVSNESGKTEVYVTPFPIPGGKRQISGAGGANPKWRQDGKELFYTAPGGQIMSAEVDANGSAFEVKKIGPLFAPGGAYDVSADGQRFLVAAPPQGATEEPLTVIQNWPATLKK